jgi:hypothetical protein
MTDVNYREGDWFAVPLRDGGFAVGVVARSNPKAALLGYFFGPKYVNVPSLNDVHGLTPESAALVCRFGHLGLIQGKWPLLGHDKEWDRKEWPVPVFIRYEELSGRSFQVFYSDEDPAALVREERISPGEAEYGPKDGLAGAGFVEKVLTGLLR